MHSVKSNPLRNENTPTPKGPALNQQPPSRIIVNLAAIRENYRILSDLSGEAECAVVLKADAYGLGVDRIAPELYRAGARTCFVAYYSEAVGLAAALGDAPGCRIYVLEGIIPGAEADYEGNNIYAVLNTPEQIAGWRQYRADTGSRKTCAVQVDTGMNRLGLSVAEFEAAAADLGQCGVDLIISHLSSADTPASPHNALQLGRVKRLRGLLQQFLPAARLSLCNSAGVLLGPDYRFDMSRPGVTLYGCNPTPGLANPMRPVLTVEAPLRQVWNIDAGEAVGYGADFVSQSAMKLGTLAIGYADGYPRSLSNSSAVATFNGHRAPLVGRISMDFTVVDLSAFGSNSPGVGDYMQLIGEHFSIDQLARCAGTISHDILTGLGRRPQWQYTNGKL